MFFIAELAKDGTVHRIGGVYCKTYADAKGLLKRTRAYHKKRYGSTPAAKRFGIVESNTMPGSGGLLPGMMGAARPNR